MRKNALFWGAILIGAGVLLLLGNLLPNLDTWTLMWPLLLILLGLWILWGVFFGQASFETETVAIALEGADQAHIRISHGAGRLRISAGADAGELIAGTFQGGLGHRVKRDGGLLEVEMRVPSDVFPVMFSPWAWGRGGLDWSFGLSEEIPLALSLETGASDTRVDLTDLQVTDLRLQTGASATEVIMPANAGFTQARIRSGAASVVVRVPSGVAARIRAGGGLAGITVDQSRFPRSGSVYQSLDYESAPNKVEVDIETGVGSIEVR